MVGFSFIPLCILIGVCYTVFERDYVHYKGSEIKAIISNKHTKLIKDGKRHKTHYYFDIQYVLKYIDEKETKYMLHKYEYEIHDTKACDYYNQYRINDCVDIKYCAKFDRKDKSIQYHKWHKLKPLLEDKRSCFSFHCCYCPGFTITAGIVALVYYLTAFLWGIWAMIFLMINQVATLVFMRYLCCPAFFAGCQTMFTCSCDGCMKYVDDPFWMKNERHDEVITEQQYNQYILKMNGDSSGLLEVGAKNNITMTKTP